jgi:clan AA aspartic protease (TIGR02281 family)
MGEGTVDMKLSTRLLIFAVIALSGAVVYLGWQSYQASVLSRPEAVESLPQSARSRMPSGSVSAVEPDSQAAADSSEHLPRFPTDALKIAAAAVPKEKKPPSARDIATDAGRLQYFESVTDRYYRNDPLDQAVELLNQLVDGYNQWFHAINEQHKSDLERLDGQATWLTLQQRQIDDYDKRLREKPNPFDRSAVDAYNSMVSHRNDLVKQLNQAIESYKQRENAYNASVQQSNQQVKAQHQQLDALRKAVDEQLEIYKQWTANNGDANFFQELNRFYAQLCQRSWNNQSPELAAMIEQVRQLRRELAGHAMRGHEKSPNGLVVVEATLCRQETCYLVVDTGATSVTIPFSMVDALGLSNHLGREVEVSLAGGVKIMGRELVIPQISVLGMEAADVRAVVLDESEVGVDGLLGLSFLSRFDFRIDRQGPNKLMLTPKKAK